MPVRENGSIGRAFAFNRVADGFLESSFVAYSHRTCLIKDSCVWKMK